MQIKWSLKPARAEVKYSISITRSRFCGLQLVQGLSPEVAGSPETEWEKPMLWVVYFD